MADSGFGASELSPSRPVIADWWTVRMDGTERAFKGSLTIDEFDGDWTVAGWINQDSAVLKVLFEVSDATLNERITIEVTAAGELQITQVDTAGANSNTLTSALTTLAVNVWHHVAVTRTTNTFEVWINGVKDVNSMVVATRPGSMGLVHLGSEHTSVVLFNGYLSQWMVFKRALTTPQLENLGGFTYGINQKSRGRINYALNFTLAVAPGTPPLRLTKWPVSLYGDPPVHQWFTLDFWDFKSDPVLGAPVFFILIDQGSAQDPLSTEEDWSLLSFPNGIFEENIIQEQGYFGFDESKLTVPVDYQSLIDPVTGADWGFGDPDPSGGIGDYDADSGFGSPHVFLHSMAIQILSPLGTYGDDGGYIVEVLADWPGQGPYRFRLVDAGSNEYPETTFCYSAVPTQGTDCYTLTGGVDVIKFTLPPAPPGVYDLQIDYGPGFGQQTVFVQALVLDTRNRSRDVYALRRRHPPHYKTGPVSSRRDVLLP